MTQHCSNAVSHTCGFFVASPQPRPQSTRVQDETSNVSGGAQTIALAGREGEKVLLGSRAVFCGDFFFGNKTNKNGAGGFFLTQRFVRLLDRTLFPRSFFWTMRVHVLSRAWTKCSRSNQQSAMGPEVGLADSGRIFGWGGGVLFEVNPYREMQVVWSVGSGGRFFARQLEKPENVRLFHLCSP